MNPETFARLTRRMGTATSRRGLLGAFAAGMAAVAAGSMLPRVRPLEALADTATPIPSRTETSPSSAGPANAATPTTRPQATPTQRPAETPQANRSATGAVGDFCVSDADCARGESCVLCESAPIAGGTKAFGYCANFACPEGQCPAASGQCCQPNRLCNQSCCDAGAVCINTGLANICCSAERACDNSCCSDGQACIDGACCTPDQMCGNTCCAGGFICQGSGASARCCDASLACGDTCCQGTGLCASQSHTCCAPDQFVCDGVACCTAGQVCTNGVCCSSGEVGCSGACCATGEVCTNGICCAPGVVACNGVCCASGQQCQVSGLAPTGACCVPSASNICGLCCPPDTPACFFGACYTNDQFDDCLGCAATWATCAGLCILSGGIGCQASCDEAAMGCLQAAGITPPFPPAQGYANLICA